MKNRNLYDFCQNIGEFSAYMIKKHLVEIGALKDSSDNKQLKKIDFEDFIKIWREQIGPQYYNNSILSINRQIEILTYLNKIFPFYIKSKNKILADKNNTEADLTKPAWFAVNTSDSQKGTCLKIGFNNHGCAYWHKSKNNIGCYNCGFFIGLPKDQDNITEKIIQQFDYTIDSVKNRDKYDSIEFLGDGSFLNEKEVPFEAQKAVFNKISQMPDVKRVLVESRPEFIDEIKIQNLLALLRTDQNLEIGIGLETIDRFTAAFCINKGFFLEMDSDIKKELNQKDIYDIITIIKPYADRVGIQFYALVKPAFLTEIEALQDSLNTGRLINKLAKQNDLNMRVKYEPVIVAKGTLLEVLHNTWISKTGELIMPEPEIEIDLFSDETPEKKPFLHTAQKNEWKPLYEPPSYWTVAELIAQLSIDGSHKIVRFGSRDDMHIPETIPGVYDNQFGSAGMLNKIDFRLYNAVQQFNIHKDMSQFLQEIKVSFENPSFKNWKDELVNLLLTQLEKDADELQIENIVQTREEEFLNVLEDLVQTLQYSTEAQIFFGSLLKKYSCLKEAHAEIKNYILTILAQKINYIKEQDIQIKSADFVANKLPHVKKPDIFKIEINVFNNNIRRNYSVSLHIPKQEISYKNYEKVKTSEIERKFIIEKIPEYLSLSSPTNILQGYISITKDNEVRIRRKTKNGKSKYLLTWKSKGDKIRGEIQDEIDESTFKKFISATKGRLIEKDRYKIKFCFINDNKEVSYDVAGCPDDKIFTIEFDIFKGHLFGLMCAEVEFKTEDQSLLLDKAKPDWFAKEVTFDKRFKNQSLSKYKLESILIRTSKKYEDICLCFSDDQVFINHSKNIAEQKGLNFRLFDELRHIETRGKINADAVDLLRSADLFIVDKACVDINLLTKVAVRETMSKRTVFADSTCMQNLDNDIEQTLKTEKNESTINLSNDVSLSEIIESQHIIDNETLAQYEQKAKEVWVITSTMEFDLGELREAVEFNLKAGKKYVYFTPHESSNTFYNELLKKNLKELERIFRNYIGTGQIKIKQFDRNFEYSFKEIVIYDALEDEPFGFTYIVNRNSEDFELIGIQGNCLRRIIEKLNLSKEGNLP
jgi:radical SAM enzyme (TIGR01210 family)